MTAHLAVGLARPPTRLWSCPSPQAGEAGPPAIGRPGEQMVGGLVVSSSPGT